MSDIEIKRVVRRDVANVSVGVTHRGPDFEVTGRRLVRRDIVTPPPKTKEDVQQ